MSTPDLIASSDEDATPSKAVALPINKKFHGDLNRLFRAKTPLIAVLTHEEQALLRTLRTFISVSAKSRQLFTWSCTRGLWQVDPVSGKESPVKPDMTKPEALFAYIQQDGDKAYYLVCDVHPWLAANNVSTVRAIRDTFGSIMGTRKTVVFSSPIFPLPPELEKAVQVISMPLPNHDILDAILVATIAEAGANNTPVDLDEAGRRDLVTALAGLTEPEAEQALAEALVVIRELSIKALPIIRNAKAAIIRKAGFEYYEPLPLEAIGGVPNVKTYAGELAASRTEAGRAFGLRPQRAALFAGPPGTGKTMITAALCAPGQPLLSASIGKLYTKELGGTEANVRRLLELVTAIGPVLRIDEAEKAFGGNEGETDGGTSGRVLEAILTFIEDNPGGALTIFTANHPEKLPPEFLSRMNKVMWLGLPPEQARKEIWQIQLRMINRDPKRFDLNELAKVSAGYVGREFRNAVDAAMLTAFAQGMPDITTDLLIQKLKAMAPASMRNQREIAELENWGKSFAEPADVVESITSMAVGARVGASVAIDGDDDMI